MREIDPGHLYRYRVFAAREAIAPRHESSHDEVRFRKRVGESYPGNVGLHYDGTTTQELLRIIIARSQYVDGQDADDANQFVIGSARRSIYELEERAARRRGAEYLADWARDYSKWLDGPSAKSIERIDPCDTCGHIFCRRHLVRQLADAVEGGE